MRALIIFLIALVVFAMPSIAEDGWTNYLSSTGVFKTRLPTGHKTALNSFLIGDKLAASHEETAGAIDQRPYKDVLMNYIVKFDQTNGPSLKKFPPTKIITKPPLPERLRKTRNLTCQALMASISLWRSKIQN